MDTAGVAQLYLIHDADGGEHVLKLMAEKDEGLRQRILREGAVLKKLNHPNVVHVEEVLEINGAPALVMEHLGGPDLARWMFKYNPLDWEYVFRDIVAGVQHIHDSGLIHRDLNPYNVMVVQDAQNKPRPVIIDFGFVKAPAVEITSPGAMMGTSGYMSPEQIQESRDVDKRSDIFSLGSLLYFMATGEEAFAAPLEWAVMNKTLIADFKPPRRVNEALPMRIVNAIGFCLSASPIDRAQNCKALITVLDGGERPVD